MLVKWFGLNFYVTPQLKAAKFGNGLELWMGECGGCSNSGLNGTTNTFMSAFWYLDGMGVLMEQGHKAFCRQTLIGGNYGLLELKDGTVKDNPDYWAALLFSKMMIGDVIEVGCTFFTRILQHIFFTPIFIPNFEI